MNMHVCMYLVHQMLHCSACIALRPTCTQLLAAGQACPTKAHCTCRQGVNKGMSKCFLHPRWFHDVPPPSPLGRSSCPGRCGACHRSTSACCCRSLSARMGSCRSGGNRPGGRSAELSPTMTGQYSYALQASNSQYLQVHVVCDGTSSHSSPTTPPAQGTGGTHWSTIFTMTVFF
jgi:hypothetical protein